MTVPPQMKTVEIVNAQETLPNVVRPTHVWSAQTVTTAPQETLSNVVKPTHVWSAWTVTTAQETLPTVEKPTPV